MFLARQPNTAVTALSLIVGALSVAFYSNRLAGANRSRSLRRRRRDRGTALAARALEGRAVACPCRLREADPGRAYADRARRQRRGHVARAPGRPALFLDRRSRDPRRRKLDGEAHPPERAGRVRRHHPRDQSPGRKAGGPAHRRGQRLAAAQPVEPRQRKPLFGVGREAVRRAARRFAVVARAA